MFKDFESTGKVPGTRKTLICHNKGKCSVTKQMCKFMKHCNGNGTCSELTGKCKCKSPLWKGADCSMKSINLD